MATMTHTPAQRKAWRGGMKAGYRNKYRFIATLLGKRRNFSGAYTPSFLKRGLYYQTLPRGKGHNPFSHKKKA